MIKDNKISNTEDCYTRSENKQENHVFTIRCHVFTNFTDI